LRPEYAIYRLTDRPGKNLLSDLCRSERSAERAGENEFLGILQPELQRTEAAHREPRDRPLVTAGVRAKLLIDLGDQFLNNVALPFLIRLRNAVRIPTVAALGHNDDEFIGLRVFGDLREVGPVIVVAGQPVEQIDNRIAGGARGRVLCGQYHPVGHIAAAHLRAFQAVFADVRRQWRCLRSLTGREGCEGGQRRKNCKWPCENLSHPKIFPNQPPVPSSFVATWASSPASSQTPVHLS